MYHPGGKPYPYTPKDGSTRNILTDDTGKYIYPNGEATPK